MAVRAAAFGALGAGRQWPLEGGPQSARLRTLADYIGQARAKLEPDWVGPISEDGQLLLADLHWLAAVPGSRLKTLQGFTSTLENNADSARRRQQRNAQRVGEATEVVRGRPCQEPVF